MMMRDFRDYRITGFNPFDPESYKSAEFHQFRDDYKKHGFAIFLINVENAARITRSSMKKADANAAKNALKRPSRSGRPKPIRKR